MTVSHGKLVFIGACLLFAVIVLTAILLLRHERDTYVKRRLLSVRGNVESQAEIVIPGSFMTGLIETLGNLLTRSGLLPARTLTELETMLNTASLGSKNNVALFIGSKLVVASGALLISVLIIGRLSIPPKLQYVLPPAGMIFGLVLPDYVVGRLRRRYLQAVMSGLPDALDMMVICSEAGLGLEPAIGRVAQELDQAHPEMARELQITAHEMQLMSDRRLVLTNLGDRTKLDSLRRLGTTLIQTMQFGTPLTQALRTLATEMRQEQMTLYEGRAAKLPVILTVPMILFILPCVFIVVAGPAALRVTGMLGKG